VHTSAKARPSSVAIRIRDLDHQQNLIIFNSPIANLPCISSLEEVTSFLAKYILQKWPVALEKHCKNIATIFLQSVLPLASYEGKLLTPMRGILVFSPQPECTSCHQQGHVGSKTLLQQNPPVLIWDAS